MPAPDAETTARLLVLCVGNDLRGDDGIGCEIARRLTSDGATGWDVQLVEDDALSLMDAWQGYERVLIVDALQANGSPGRILTLDATEGPLNAIMNDVTSHGLGLGHSLELARSLGRLPRRCLVVGMEGARFTIGDGLSPEVADHIPALLTRIGEAADHLRSGRA